MSDDKIYLCTKFVLSSDFVQRSQLKSMVIWHNIFLTSFGDAHIGKDMRLLTL